MYVKMLILITVLSACVYWSQSATVFRKNGCIISFPKRNDLLQPVVLTNQSSFYNFAIPTGNNLIYGDSEPISLLCSPANNHIEGTYTNLTSFLCSGGETLRSKTRTSDFESINCKSYAKAGISVTRTKCGRNLGNIVNIGYQVSKKQFLTLITTCYDSSRGNALYTNHTVYGQAYPAFSQQSFRPPFSEVGVPYDLKPSELYKQKNQKQALAGLLGSASALNQYYTSSQFLARGHLSPDADFVYAPLQFATYFYVNICPQWQSINAGNWLAIESMVRKTSGKIKQPLQVFTGSHDVLTLPDVNGYPAEIYLETSGRIPVPKYLWKIVYNERTREGIAFVAINNPFLDEVYEEDLLCKDICDEYYWSRANFGVIKKGYVFCCDVMDLKKIVTTIPYLRMEGILRA